jgi:hypothetical protein
MDPGNGFFTCDYFPKIDMIFHVLKDLEKINLDYYVFKCFSYFNSKFRAVKLLTNVALCETTYVTLTGRKTILCILCTSFNLKHNHGIPQTYIYRGLRLILN